MKIFHITAKKIVFCLVMATSCYGYDIELAVCGIFQNEARFIKEWIEFHKLVGAQHFYLYNNYSTDNYLEVLDPYIKSGLVEIIDWPKSDKGLRAQITAFNDCLNTTVNKVKWIAFLDLDEYLYPVEKWDLKDVLKEFEQFGQVSVNWFMFGTSGVEKIPDGEIMIEYLTKCDPKGNKHVKSIVRPDCVKQFSCHPHSLPCKDTYCQVNADKKRIHGPFSPQISDKVLRINHYWTRDEYHLKIKIARIKDLSANKMVLDDTSWYVSRKESHNMTAEQWILAVNNYINVADDFTILKYLPKLKEQMSH